MARSLAIDQMLASRTRRSFHPSILEDHRERRASAVRERIRSALTIVPDESPDSHRLHRLREDPDRGVVNASRGAKQDHAILGTEVEQGASARWRISVRLGDAEPMQHPVNAAPTCCCSA